MILTANDLTAMTAILGEPERLDEKTLLWNLRDGASGRVLAVTLTSGVQMEGGEESTVVSAQTHQGYVELHDVTAYLCIEPDEVMFIAKRDDRFSSLVVGRTCTCSQFANIRPSLIKADLTSIDPTLLMAAMQLSLAESLIDML